MRLTVDEGEGERVDAWLADRVPLSRTRIARLIGEGRVRVDGAPPKKSDPVERGQRIEVEVPPPEPLSAEPEAIPLEIVYQDEALLVVNKPPGMVVHPAPGHPRGTLVNALLHHVDDLAGIGGKLRPGIVHRLDKDTSGLLVVAKRDDAHRALSDALRRRDVRRLYQAASWGHLSESPLRIDAPIGRDPNDRKRMAVVEDGRRAVTHVRVRERWVAAELLDVKLETGRTHQIRVHLAHVGHPVVGDETYGEGWERGMSGPGRPWARELARRAKRQFLHAAVLGFRHPLTEEELRFRAPLPPDLADVAEWARTTSREGL
ncbi:MAG: RluA family pseudouridine synthase [Gemmatimonadetes bacterium]|nr:RluA family pseudouridine synthase [Gemmatimonadota bacterium]NIR80272.1 RluA family pseudouridine synthase [Gemmatimonadota bacterium]NIT89030.1 RluA family pseudouridine synthase [Gemmatimonadota bacterium]NIU32828.1 RluA family pseudouridine synthase [Gemmatimonadota bacterium]NIU37248.1 RluA family pseudouridine synthase [Gemmatimonadota bacterium]